VEKVFTDLWKTQFTMLANEAWNQNVSLRSKQGDKRATHKVELEGRRTLGSQLCTLAPSPARWILVSM